MLANPSETRGRHRVNNMNPEAALEADGWGNSMIEAYTDCPARSALWMRSHPAGPEGTKSHRPQGGSHSPIVVRDGSAGHREKEWAGSNASTGITSGHEYSRSNGVKLPACNGDRFWHSVPEAVPRARYPEEPGAVIPHAGICEGGTGQPVSLPQSLLK